MTGRSVSSPAGGRATSGEVCLGAAAAAGGAPTIPKYSLASCSMTARTWPTWARPPSGTRVSTTRPATGEVSSTVALADSTWHNGWKAATWSPGWTFQASTWTSWMPSPTSASLNSNGNDQSSSVRRTAERMRGTLGR